MELEDVFKKLQKSPGISIKKITSSKSSNSTVTSEMHVQNEIFIDEMDEKKIKDEEQDELLVTIDNISQNYYENDHYHSDVDGQYLDANDDHYHDEDEDEFSTESLDGKVDSSEYSCDEDSDQNYVPSNSKSFRKPHTPAKPKSTNAVEKFIDAPIVFNCTKCKNNFNSFNELVEHMKSKVCFTEVFNCDICLKNFLNNRSLNRHKRTHKPKLKLMCEECAKTFSNKFDLEMHMQSVHNHEPNKNSKLIFKCTYCLEKFSNHIALFTHVKEHLREKKEGSKLCETCGKNCINLKSYQAHIKTHADVVKKFICPVCDKRFAKGFLLTQHSHIHTGVKMYDCNFCEKAFAKRDSLRIHKKKHHHDKTAILYDYTCEDCKVGFNSFEQFKIHVTKCNSQFS